MARTKSSITNWKPSKAKWSRSKTLSASWSPQPASSPPRSDLHHHLLPHHYIPPLSWPAQNYQHHQFHSTKVASSYLPPQCHLPPSPLLTPPGSFLPYPSHPSHLVGVPSLMQPLSCHLYETQWKNFQYHNQQLGCGKGQWQHQQREEESNRQWLRQWTGCGSGGGCQGGGQRWLR